MVSIQHKIRQWCGHLSSNTPRVGTPVVAVNPVGVPSCS